METKRLTVRFTDKGNEKVPAMHTFLIVLLIWITPSFLFIGWRLWMSRPLRDLSYRDSLGVQPRADWPAQRAGD
jgi:hypothetical protein